MLKLSMNKYEEFFMINFNTKSVFNLKPIDASKVREDIKRLLLPDEEVIDAFKTVRDQLVFTNKRIIAVDIQGMVGKKKSYTSLPYSKIQYFSIQTPSLIEIFPDSELYLVFPDGFAATFEFKGSIDITRIIRVISEYTL